MFTMSTPLNETFKKHLIHNLEKLSGFSDWHVDESAGMVVWSEISERVAEAVKIKMTTMAKVTLVPRADNPAMCVIKCEALDVQQLFRQNASSLRATAVTEEQKPLLLSLLARILTKIKTAMPTDKGNLPYAINAGVFILKLSHALKKVVDSHIQPQTLSISLKDYHPTLQTLKIQAFYSAESRRVKKLPEWSLVLVFKDKEKERECYFLQDQELSSWITALKDVAFKLNLEELTLSKGYIEYMEPYTRLIPLPTWDMEWDNPQHVGLYYDKISDLQIMDAFSSEVLAIASALKEGDVLNIIDIGAGKGRLAYKLIQLMDNLGIPYHYTFVEPRVSQIERARHALGAHLKNIRFVNTTLETLVIDEKAHCVISSGGPLCVDIVTRAQAISNAKKMHDMLFPGGVLIAVGQTALLVKTKHFKLDILSCSVPCVVPTDIKDNAHIKQSSTVGTFFGHFQRYVLKKTEMTTEDELAVGSDKNIAAQFSGRRC